MDKSIESEVRHMSDLGFQFIKSTQKKSWIFPTLFYSWLELR